MTMHTNCLNLLIMMLLGLCPGVLHANDEEKSVILYTPYTQISVPPGESITYNVEVVNRTGEVENAALSVDGLPRGWSSEMTAGGYTIGRLAVLPDEKKSFTLKVSVPLQVNKGTYRFTLKAAGLAELPLSVTVARKGTYRTDFTTDQPNMQGNAKSNFTFSATLKNQTAEQQLYALMADAPRGWNVIFKANYKQATSAQVEPNASQNISIEITPPASVAAGTYKIPVHATTGSTSADLTLEVVVTGSYEIDLSTPSGLLSTHITAGDTKRIDLVVRNAGSAELKDIQLSAGKPAEWEVTFEPAGIGSLKAGETAPVTAVLKAYKKALPGDYVTRFTAKTPEVSATSDFRVSVRTSML